MPDQKTILIIDDEIELCQLLKNYFLRKQYQVHLSHTLKDGLNALEVNEPDIVFLDNNLPDGTGWDIAPEIAANHKEIFIVLISGYHPSFPQMPTAARYKIIEKPISFSDIENSLADVI